MLRSSEIIILLCADLQPIVSFRLENLFKVRLTLAKLLLCQTHAPAGLHSLLQFQLHWNAIYACTYVIT